MKVIHIFLMFLNKLFQQFFGNKKQKPKEENKPKEEKSILIEEIKEVSESESKMSKYVWLLDNGHGKDTPGKRSSMLSDGRQFFEYEFNRKVVSKLSLMLAEANISGDILVPEVEDDIKLSERIKRSDKIITGNDQKKIYLSIHANAYGNSGWSSPSGTETYHYAGSKSGRKLAAVFQEHLVEEMGRKDRGIKTANFYVLRKTSMPSILTECGFYTNKEECEYLLSDEGVNAVANAHFKAIEEIEKDGKI